MYICVHVYVSVCVCVHMCVCAYVCVSVSGMTSRQPTNE